MIVGCNKNNVTVKSIAEEIMLSVKSIENLGC